MSYTGLLLGPLGWKTNIVDENFKHHDQICSMFATEKEKNIEV